MSKKAKAKSNLSDMLPGLFAGIFYVPGSLLDGGAD